MKLAEWAQRQGISYTTAWRWTKENAMPVPWRKTPSGTILVEVPMGGKPAAVALYARVSSHDQRNDLDRQLARLSHYAAEHDLHVVET
ncbi:MAG: recombinase family protein, partial [Vulcanimicrobiaceae bacterium]